MVGEESCKPDSLPICRYRFLQGEGTDSTPVRELRQAIAEGKACVVQVC